ncbi:hypothetical protein Tco_0396894 [Tanacetum coccineum]
MLNPYLHNHKDKTSNIQAWCGSGLSKGFCFICALSNENSSIDNPNPNFFNDSLDFSDFPPQPQHETYSCELCGNDAHYGYDCPPQVPFVYNQDPCFNQDFDNFPQTSPNFQQQYLGCENCGGPHENFQCQPLNQNFYEPNHCYNSNSFGFDQSQPPQFPVIHQPPQETSVEILQARENLMKSIQTFLKKFDRISFRETPKVLLLAWEKFFEIKHACREKQHQPEDLQELLHKLLKDLQIISEELADYINTPNWNCPAFYEDDDEEYTIAITPVLPTEEPDNSLRINEADFDPEEEIRLVEKLLYDNSSPRPPKEFNSKNSDAIIESFSPSPIPVEDRDIIFLEELLSNDSPSLPVNESFHFDVPSSPRPPAKPPDDGIYFEPDTGVFTKVVDDISDNSTRELYVHVPNILPTLPTLSSMFDTLLPFSSENEDKVHLLSHRGFKTFPLSSESTMMISGGDIPILDVPISPDYEASRARGFVLRSLELQSLA